MFSVHPHKHCYLSLFKIKNKLYGKKKERWKKRRARSPIFAKLVTPLQSKANETSVKYMYHSMSHIR